MKYENLLSSFLYFTILLMYPAIAGAQTNRAACLDGKENNLCTGMGIIDGPWTLEAWIRRDENSRKEIEVIFGGGEYSDLRYADNLPLVIRNGRLHSTQANLWSASVLDNEWHHVALACDYSHMYLYLDGSLEDSKKITRSIVVGALGINMKAGMAFAGLLDEVRIWQSALSLHTLREWMCKPIAPLHPGFKTLKGYYNFDEEAGSVFINRVGKGIQPFHIRNYRVNYYSNAPCVRTVPNDNNRFAVTPQQELFNAVVIESEWDTDQGTIGDPILKLRIIVSGQNNPLSLTALKLDLSETSSLGDISQIHIYSTGDKARSAVRRELFGGGRKPEKIMEFKSEEGAFTLHPGVNYFLVTADIKEKAAPGNRIKIKVPSFSLDYAPHIPETSGDNPAKVITPKGKNYLKQLDWNIWHAGRHLAENGVDRIIDLIRAADADIVTMQEAYGSQKVIAESLGYHLQTASQKDNLALFSRYPIRELPATESLKSNPGVIVLPGGHEVLVNCCWLRYSYNPEYTGNYPDEGHDPGIWVAEDSIRPLIDIRNIIEKDTRSHLRPGMSAIIAGDFNSCSHLDWTAGASSFHYGYGPVPFPVSRFMQEEGFKDSFRELHPDETLRPEGTFAVIYNQLQYNRIDFIYYKSDKIKAVNSRIIRTPHEIDDVWASDHAAVMTTFEISGALNPLKNK
ncbi:MAG: endonuclease/exonuclease/phosphatase family protein [Tannerellaceae bacterium]|jgi:endonuclease/exonuclease/phosphatase family metal-dependent hydrolase|nr:endonuclease/exonuclease/phosphatase family protein [Tannerellaceae bacterium]